MSILSFPFWKTRDDSIQQSPDISFEISVDILRSYVADIEKHGMPLDSDLPAYFRKCADYFERQE